MVNEIVDGQITVHIDTAVISEKAVAKCLYWHSDRFRISQFLGTDGVMSVKLMPLQGLKVDLEQCLVKLERDLLDWNLREIVAEETIHIRHLLIAKAFSHGEYDSDPQSDVSDPVGFNPGS